MNNENDLMMNILYSPATYTHKSHYPDNFRSNKISGFVLNYWILDNFQLHDLPETWKPNDELSSLILINWGTISLAADLIGGYLLRNKLPLFGDKLMTNPCLLAFISLPLLHNAYFTSYETILDTASYGAAFIFNMFSELPSALKKRYLLLFPVSMKLPQIYAPRTPCNINLLEMALNYAHNKQ